MATLPIYLEVEDVAVGPVMIALRRMSGIIKMKLDLEVGGAAAIPAARQGGARTGPTTNADMIKQRLFKENGGALNVNVLASECGIIKSSVYTALNNLKNQGIVVGAEGKGNWRLTARVIREMGETKEGIKMLPHHAAASRPTPAHTNGAQVTKGPGGRASPGSGWELMRKRLEAGGARRQELMEELGRHGVSQKSVSGVIGRAQQKKLISNATGQWELTAKGRQEQPTQAAE